MRVNRFSWIYRALHAPLTRGQTAVSAAVLFFIVASIFMLAIEALYPKFVVSLGAIWTVAQVVLISVFSIEYCARFFVTRKPLRYAFSLSGVVDFTAFAPSAVSLVLTGTQVTGWLRVLRLGRLLKVLLHTRNNRTFRYGLIPRVITMVGIAFVFKSLIVLMEGQGWSIDVPGSKLLTSVIGFAIGVLLSTKLRTAQGRLYSFEDTLSSLVGAMSAAMGSIPDRGLLLDWSQALERVLITGSGEAPFRQINERFVAAGTGVIPGPIWLTINTHSEYLLQRIHTRTPPVYDRMLRHITILYCAAIAVLIPGIGGMVATVIVVYILGGMLVVIDSMDRTVEGNSGALIDADISTLRNFNERVAETLA